MVAGKFNCSAKKFPAQLTIANRAEAEFYIGGYQSARKWLKDRKG